MNLSYLTVQVTLEGMSVKDWLKEVFTNHRGLRSHGRKSNKILASMIRDPTQRALLRRVNMISLDYCQEEVCRAVVGMNFL